MKLLVIQEQHFTKLSNGEVWVDKQSDIHFWDRYLTVFDEIVVCARMRQANKLERTGLRSDRSRVSFVGLPDFRGVAGIVKNYIQITKILNKVLDEVDCVIFRAPSPISMVAYGPIKRSGKPFAVELMNNPYTHFSKESMNNKLQPLIRLFITNQTRRMCLRANGVAYVTKHTLQGMYPMTKKGRALKKNRFEAAYSTIRLTKDDFSPNQETKRPETFTLVHSGAMADQRKGQDVFLDCVRQLEDWGYAIKGVLIGDGTQRKTFEEYAKEIRIYADVDFVGWKSGFKEVQKELKRGQFFIFPSKGEGLPRSVIEAMASGLLCIGTDIDGIPELLNERCLVKENSGLAFAEKVRYYIDHWDEALLEQKVQFNKSTEFEDTLLTEKRNLFYKELKNSVESR